jgi:anion-transporting  ArsA/GET3 family ATPase
MLGKAWWHTTEKLGAGFKYDLVVLDGPASGHGLAMLRIPQAILDAAPSGPLVTDARALRSLLLNPVETALVPVTLPEELPVNETLELLAAVRQEKALRLPLGPVIVNAVPPGRLSEPGVAAVLDALPAKTGDAELDATLAMADGIRSRRRTAEAMLARLRERAELRLATLPWIPSTDLGLRDIDRLASELEAAVG